MPLPTRPPAHQKECLASEHIRLNNNDQHHDSHSCATTAQWSQISILASSVGMAHDHHSQTRATGRRTMSMHSCPSRAASVSDYDRSNASLSPPQTESLTASGSSIGASTATPTRSHVPRPSSCVARRRDEIHGLQAEVQSLEQVATSLRKRTATDMLAGSAPDTVRTGRMDDTLSWHDMWETVVARQRELRRHAEMENKRLREMVAQDVAMARERQQMREQHCRLSSSMHSTSRAYSHSSTRAIGGQECGVATSSLQALPRGIEMIDEEEMRQCVADLYAQRASAFATPCFRSSNSSFLHVDTRTEPNDSRLISIQVSWMVPFDAFSVADRMWEYLLRKHPHNQRIVECEDSCVGNDLVVSVVAAEPVTNMGLGTYGGKQAIQRFTDTHEVVIVSNVRLQPTNRSVSVTGSFSIHAESWLRVHGKSVTPASTNGNPLPWQLAQVQWHRRVRVTPLALVPHTGGGGGEGRRRHEGVAKFTEVVVQELKEDINRSRQNVENYLLQAQISA